MFCICFRMNISSTMSSVLSLFLIWIQIRKGKSFSPYCSLLFDLVQNEPELITKFTFYSTTQNSLCCCCCQILTKDNFGQHRSAAWHQISFTCAVEMEVELPPPPFTLFLHRRGDCELLNL